MAKARVARSLGAIRTQRIEVMQDRMRRASALALVKQGRQNEEHHRFGYALLLIIGVFSRIALKRRTHDPDLFSIFIILQDLPDPFKAIALSWVEDEPGRGAIPWLREAWQAHLATCARMEDVATSALTDSSRS